MKYFAYILAFDSGFAPNPFYGYCTLADCKPKIRKQAQVGDWIIGLGSKKSEWFKNEKLSRAFNLCHESYGKNDL